jgi:hypothetical protein
VRYLLRNNCWSYACDELHPPGIGVSKPQPGEDEGYGLPTIFNCIDVKVGARKHHLINGNKGECPCAYCKVRLYFRGNGVRNHFSFIFKSACAHRWPGVCDRNQAKSVVPKRQAPTSHRDNLRPHPAGRKAEKPRTLESRSALLTWSHVRPKNRDITYSI